jgi:hypothetical protein
VIGMHENDIPTHIIAKVLKIDEDTVRSIIAANR